MWPFKKKPGQSRLEVLKSRPSRREPQWRWFRQPGGPASFLLASALLVAAIAIDAFPLDPIPYRLGQYVRQDIQARIDFSVPSQRAMLERLGTAKLSTPPVYQAEIGFVDRIVSTIATLPGSLTSTSRPVDLPEAVRRKFSLDDSDSLAAWKAYAAEPGREELDRSLGQLRNSLLKTCLITADDMKFQKDKGTAREVVLLSGSAGKPQRAEVGEMIGLDDKGEVSNVADRMSRVFAEGVRASVRAYLLDALGGDRPLYRCDAAATQREIDLKIAQIRSDPPRDRYAVGQILVHAQREGEGAPAVIAATDTELLEYEHKAYVAAERQSHPWRRIGRLVGRAAIVAIVLALLCLYVANYQCDIVRNAWQCSALTLLLILMLAVGKSLVFLLELSDYSALFVVMFVGIVVSIAYGQRFALALGAALSMLVVLQLRQDHIMLIALLAGVGATVFQLHEIRTRSKLIRVSAFSAAVVFAAICALGLAGSTPWRFVLTNGLWAVGAALAAGMVAQVLLPLVELVFGIATSMTLLEWCDASKPLLKRLATEAPGTWNHCLQLGSMCEAAAEGIGANGLLARVGAYYHDIGKINKPDYFVENQGGSPSKHEKLSPEMSLLVILGHVKDGLEMARASGLPQILHQFITTHHGTTLVQYFYHAATEQRKGETGRKPEEVEFRYPGPKPRTKETAILMLADAAESSVRSMSEPTPGRIEGQVHTMVNRRLMDGQLDECEMTLREVHQVESSLVKNLCGIYHARISYPTPEGQAPSAGEVRVRNEVKTGNGTNAGSSPGPADSKVSDPA